MTKRKAPLMNKENDNTNAYGTGLSVKKHHGRKNAEIFSSQSITTDNASQIELSQERLSTRTDIIDQSNSECLFEENRTPVINRCITGQSSSISRTPLSADRIVVSVDRRQRELNEDLNLNHTSNTPIRPFRHNQICNSSTNDKKNAFSLDSI
ncbi:unnamed protein product, partial [Rotaria socialis]